MARQKAIKKREILPDPLYMSKDVSKFVNQVMRKGKKSVARKIVYSAFLVIKEKLKQDPMDVFQKAIENVIPAYEVRGRRIGGATYQVPMRLKEERAEALAMRWIIEAAKTRKGAPMAQKLSQELIDAFNETGKAVTRKRDTHRMAEANRAFAHFRL